MPRKKADIAEWTSPTGLLLVQYMCMNGATEDDVAKRIGISRRQLYRWKDKEPKLALALQNGKEASVAAVTNKVYQMAMHGNMTAAIWYLKNRDPEHWSDHPELKNVKGKVVFVDDIPRVQAPATDDAGQREPGDQADRPDHP